MATIRTQLLDLVVTMLNSGTPGGVPQSRRGFLFSVGAVSLPTISVYPAKEDAVLQLGNSPPGLTKNTMMVQVEVRQKGDASNSADKLAEPLLAWVEKALSGQRPTDNVGLFHLMWKDSLEWDYDQMEHGFVLAKMTIGVQYQTKTTDPEARA